MKGADRTILIVLAAVGLVAAFWLLLLGPKRQEASQLEEEVSALSAEVSAAEEAALAGEDAKASFSASYQRLVSLGKAAPKDADTSSLLVQLQTLSERSDVDFRSIILSSDAAGAAPATPVAPATPPPAEEGATEEGEAATPAGTTIPGEVPTEATAALLPIGATVGPAGLPVMPYDLEFEGGFFQVADFFGRLDEMVKTRKTDVRVDGRLLTINGFTLKAGASGFPDLNASVQATSYLTPADQGVTAGATPSGPTVPAAPATEASTAPPVATATPVGG